MRFNDRFSVNGIMFPRTITITTGNSYRNTVRQITEVQINTKLGLENFEPYQVDIYEQDGKVFFRQSKNGRRPRHAIILCILAIRLSSGIASTKFDAVDHNAAGFRHGWNDCDFQSNLLNAFIHRFAFRNRSNWYESAAIFRCLT